MKSLNQNLAAYTRILHKRTRKKKSYKPEQEATNKPDAMSPTKLVEKQKENEVKMFLSKMYSYFINDSAILDEIHLKQSDQVFDFDKNFLTTDEFADQDLDYLSEVEIREIKDCYKDYRIGDYLIVFPNPDHHERKAKDRPIYYKEALEVYDMALAGKSQESLNKVQMMKEKLAFIKAFNSLENYEKEVGAEDSEEDENFDEEVPGKKNKKSFLGKLFGGDKKKTENINNNQNEKKSSSFFSFLKRKKDNNNNSNNTPKSDFTERKTLKRQNSIILTPEEEKLLQKEVFETEQDFKELKDLKMIFKKLKRIKTVRKRLTKGGFLKWEKKDGFDYYCKNEPAKDFLTLIRNVIVSKLTMLAKMHVRIFLYSTGEDLLMVLKCDEDILTRHAESIGMTKQMELGACDLMSLEPVDRRLRPLRIKNYMKMDESEYQEYYSERMKKRGMSKKEKKEEEISNEIFTKFNGMIMKHIESTMDDPKKDEYFKRYLQDCCRDFYKNIKNIKEDQLRTELMIKNEEINTHLKNLAKDYKIEVPDTNTNIQNDCDISKEEWLAYFIYLCYLKKYFDLLTDHLKDNHLVKENFLFLLKLIFRKAVGDSNEIHDEFNKGNFFLRILGLQKKKSLLKTIWSYLHMDPSPPFNKFFLMSKSKEQRREEKRQQSAEIKDKKQKNQSQEEVQISKFQKEINDKQLNRSGMIVIEDKKPKKEGIKKKEKVQKNLWRTYEVNEDGERSIFLNMEKMKLINDIILKYFNMVYLIKHQYIASYFPLHNYYELSNTKTKNYFKNLEHAELIKPKAKQEDYKKLYSLFMDLSDEAESTDFDSDGSCLEEETKFNYKRPWYVNIETIRNYFGEKIAIYFSFLSFYTLEMAIMALLGFIAQVLIFANAQADAVKLSFSILIIVWSTVFIEMWKRRQAMFAIKYGQMDFQEEESERPDFKGEYTRSVVDDDYNLTYFNANKKKMRMIFSFFVSLLLIACVIFCVYGIFVLKAMAYCYHMIDGICVEIENNDVVQILLTQLNTVQIVLFNKVYGFVALKLNNYENHKLFSSYENSLVLKIFFFNFVNTFFSLVFVAFFNPVFPLLNLCKINNNCYDSLTRQMMVIFLTFFVSNVGEILVPFINILVNVYKAKKSDSSFNSSKYILLNVDQVIEKDYRKTDYHPSMEIDGTVDDYMEMIMQFGFLNLFGMSFPLAFTLAFFNDIAEIQVDKMKLVHFKRRPIPKGAANIGTWLVILDLISFLAIFSNTGIIILTAGVAGNSSISTLFLFMVLLLIFLGLKYVIRFVIPDVPQKANILNQRHNFIIEKCSREATNKNVNYIPCNGSTVVEGVLPMNTDLGTSSNPTEEKGMKAIKLQEINIEKIKKNK